MSLTNIYAPVTYTGNNSTVTAYVIPFPFFDATDIRVTVVNPATGTETPLALTSGFTVTGGNGATGNAFTVAAVAANRTVRIERKLPLTQPATFTDSGPFPAATVDRALNRATMQIQQIAQTTEKNDEYVEALRVWLTGNPSS